MTPTLAKIIAVHGNNAIEYCAAMAVLYPSLKEEYLTYLDYIRGMEKNEAAV